MKHILLLTLLLTALQASIGHITSVTGNATLVRSHQDSQISKGLLLLEKDLIKTSAQSKVQAILNDDTVITVGPKTEYLFEAFQDTGEIKVQMQIKRGFFKSVTGKIGKIAPERFKIKTQAASIGIRGTQFMAYVEDDTEIIGCIKGAIIVWTNSGLTFEVPAGKMLVYKGEEWSLKEIDVKIFAPVMLGMHLQQAPRQLLSTPDAQKQTLIDEQILNRRSSRIGTIVGDTLPVPPPPVQEPFDINLNVDNSTQPPPYNP